MTIETIVIKLIEKVLTLEKENERLTEESIGWQHRLNEVAAERNLADKGQRDLQHSISQQNLEVIELKDSIKNLDQRIRYALDNCPICSPKPGTPDLCPTCVMLQAGYLPGSKEQYDAYLKR